jgi:hypothetical protein
MPRVALRRALLAVASAALVTSACTRTDALGPADDTQPAFNGQFENQGADN